MFDRMSLSMQEPCMQFFTDPFTGRQAPHEQSRSLFFLVYVHERLDISKRQLMFCKKKSKQSSLQCITVD
jgi:hypothetical protein